MNEPNESTEADKILEPKTEGEITGEPKPNESTEGDKILEPKKRLPLFGKPVPRW